MYKDTSYFWDELSDAQKADLGGHDEDEFDGTFLMLMEEFVDAFTLLTLAWDTTSWSKTSFFKLNEGT